MKNKTITIILSILILGSVGGNIYQTITKQQIQSELDSVSAQYLHCKIMSIIRKVNLILFNQK